MHISTRVDASDPNDLNLECSWNEDDFRVFEHEIRLDFHRNSHESLKIFGFFNPLRFGNTKFSPSKHDFHHIWPLEKFFPDVRRIQWGIIHADPMYSDWGNAKKALQIDLNFVFLMFHFFSTDFHHFPAVFDEIFFQNYTIDLEEFEKQVFDNIWLNLLYEICKFWLVYTMY